MIHFSVIIPSKLDKAPNGRLWLERALTSVWTQRYKPYQVVVAIDEGVVPPTVDGASMPVRWINWPGIGHQGAMNHAASTCSGSHFAFLEDDDWWLSNHLSTLVRFCRDYPFIGCSQSQWQGSRPWDILDFPTASGWCVEAGLWRHMQGVNEEYKIHHDNEFLCRLRASGVKNAHIVGRDGKGNLWLQNQIQRRAHAMILCPELEIQVRREVHQASIMGQVYSNLERADLSRREKERLIGTYGDEGY